MNRPPSGWFTPGLAAHVQARSDAGETMREIASSLGKSLPAFLQAANLAGVRVRRKWQIRDERIAAAIELVRSGKRPGEAARIAGCNAASLRPQLVRHGLTRKRMTEFEIHAAHAMAVRHGLRVPADMFRRSQDALRQAFKRMGLVPIQATPGCKARRTAAVLAIQRTTEERSAAARAVSARMTAEQRSAVSRKGAVARTIRNMRPDGPDTPDTFAARWEREVRSLMCSGLDRDTAEERVSAAFSKRLRA